MKATLCSLALLALAAPALAGGPCGRPCIPTAPDTYGPYYYATYPQGGVYGPNYNLRPWFPPFNGMILPPQCPQGPGGAGAGGPGSPPGFPNHPFARSPRDFFMID